MTEQARCYVHGMFKLLMTNVTAKMQ